ncbi:MAG: rhodanese-related sulfurtransferase [Nanoarchaeota archaeon]|nr:rhodanese-related sulfurtransferase [Nanoarchaeota archaeon]
MEKTHILLFYKYVKVEDPTKFAKEHLSFCKNLGIKGRILVAQEGINGSISGIKSQVEDYKRELREDKRFEDIIFKEDLGFQHPFKRMVVKVKNEIVNLGQKVDLKDTGKHLSPAEFLEIYKNGGDVVVLDARNDYESKVGKFKNAITPDIKTFREFPKVLDLIKDKKEKKIVMYCTGGIRCEKASAYLKENGFKDVSQLSGGILTFGKEFPDTIWEGKCFVFDKRLTSRINSDNDTITHCEGCGVLCDLYRNCSNKDCDKYTILCVECERKLGGCCSQSCFQKFMKERMEKANLNMEN